MEAANSTVTALNQALRKDSNAIHALIRTWVPCNPHLADDPHVQVSNSPMLIHKGTSCELVDRYRVGTLGLINAVLSANGLPLVAARFEEGELLGFCEYDPSNEN